MDATRQCDVDFQSSPIAGNRCCDDATVNGRRAALTLASVAMMSLAFPPIGWGPIAFVALVPLLAICWETAPASSAGWGTLVGVGAGLTLGGWVFTAIGIASPEQGARTLGWLAGATWVVGLPMAGLFAIASASRNLPSTARAAAFGGAAFAIDLARSYVPGLIPFLMLGHTQSAVPGVAQLAAIGGVPLVSGFVAFVNAAVTNVLVASEDPRSARSTAFAGAAAAAALALAGLPATEWARGVIAERTTDARVLAVQPNVPPEARWAPQAQGTHLRQLMDLTERELAGSPALPELVVWPESALTGSIVAGTDLRRRLGDAVASLGIPTIFGGVLPATSGRADRYRNAAIHVDPRTGELAAIAEKEIGVPIAESSEFPGGSELRTALGMRASWQLEEAPPSMQQPGGASYAAVLCYELLFPRLVARRAAGDVRYLLYLASDTWAGGDALREQVLGIAAFRAIELRMPVVRVSDGGSAVMDAYGRTVAELAADRGDARIVSIRSEPRVTARECVALAGVALGGALLGWILSLVHYHFDWRSTVRLTRRAAFLLLCCSLLAVPGAAQEVGTLTLDGLSFLDLDGTVLQIPSGSTIRFDFGKPSGDTIPFTISPGGVKILPLEIDSEEQLVYSLLSNASGTLRRAPDGSLSVELSGMVAVASRSPEGGSSAAYPIRLTTGTSSAADRQSGEQVSIEGLPISRGSRYMQLVTTVTNRPDGMIAPGAAIRSVLSGTFDQLPSL